MATSTDTGLSKKTMQTIYAVLAFMAITSAIIWNLKDTPPNRSLENISFANGELQRQKTEQLKLIAEAASRGASPQVIGAMLASSNPEVAAQLQAQFQPKVTNIPAADCSGGSEQVLAGVSPYRKGFNETVVVGVGCAIVQLDGSVNELVGDGEYLLAVPGGATGFYNKCGTISFDNDHEDCVAFLKKFSTRAVRVIVKTGSVTIS